jgi:hypothetical protein
MPRNIVASAQSVCVRPRRAAEPIALGKLAIAAIGVQDGGSRPEPRCSGFTIAMFSPPCQDRVDTSPTQP